MPREARLCGENHLWLDKVAGGHTFPPLPCLYVSAFLLSLSDWHNQRTPEEKAERTRSIPQRSIMH